MPTLKEISELSIASIDDAGNTIFSITQLEDTKLQFIIDSQFMTIEELNKLFNTIEEVLSNDNNNNLENSNEIEPNKKR